jgi:hypothetical protein
MQRRRPKTKRSAPTISGDELRQALTTLEMTPDAFAARGGWHRSICFEANPTACGVDHLCAA